MMMGDVQAWEAETEGDQRAGTEARALGALHRRPMTVPASEAPAVNWRKDLKFCTQQERPQRLIAPIMVQTVPGKTGGSFTSDTCVRSVLCGAHI